MRGAERFSHNARVLLAELVTTSTAVAATRSRLAKVAALADVLRRAEPGEIAIVVSYLSGELRQRRSGVGWAALRDLPPPAAVPSLQVSVDPDGWVVPCRCLEGCVPRRSRCGSIERAVQG